MIGSRRRKVVAGRVAQRAEARRSLKSAGRPAGLQIHIGQLVEWDNQGPVVDYPGNERGRLRARFASSGPESPRAPRKSGQPIPTPTGRDVVLLIDPNHRRPPVLLGYLAPLVPDPQDGELEARVDGRRVEIEGRDEIVLRCGDASITLRRNGRIAIRGVDVETRAAGSNRIRGGTVDIN